MVKPLPVVPLVVSMSERSLPSQWKVLTETKDSVPSAKSMLAVLMTDGFCLGVYRPSISFLQEVNNMAPMATTSNNLNVFLIVIIF